MNKHIEEMAKELSGYLAGVDIERAREILTSIYQRGREDERLEMILKVGAKKFSKDFGEDMHKLANE